MRFGLLGVGTGCLVIAENEGRTVACRFSPKSHPEIRVPAPRPGRCAIEVLRSREGVRGSIGPLASLIADSDDTKSQKQESGGFWHGTDKREPASYIP